MLNIFTDTPISLCKALQKYEMDNLSQSHIIVVGSPFSQYQWLKNNSTICSTTKVVTIGTNCMSEPSQSVIEQIILNPSSNGKGPTKLIATLSPLLSGTGKGCNGPAGLVIHDLFFLTVDTPRDICDFKILLHIGPIIRRTKGGICFVCLEMA